MEFQDELSFCKIALSTEFGMWNWETQTNALYFNKAYMDMLGYAHDRFPFRLSTWTQLLHPADRDKVLRAQQALLEDPRFGDTIEDQFRLRTASGAYLRVLRRGFVLGRGKDGRALRLCGMHFDLGMLERVMEEMAVRHDRMSFALEAANDGLWDWNPQTDEVYFSPRYIAMLGYRPEDFPPTVHSWSSRIHPDDLGKTVDTQREYIKSPALGDSFDCVYRFLDAKGEYRWILGRGKVTQRDAAGRGTRVVGLHTDVTALRNAQEALVERLHRDSLTRLYSRFYFDTALRKIEADDYPLGMIFCDLDGLKLINDILGHADGDRMLTQAAALLQQALPPEVTAARLGGDEFAVLLRRTSAAETQEIARRIEAENERYNCQAQGLPLYLSLGVATCEGGVSPYALLSQADKAMLENKQRHKSARQRNLLSRIEALTGHKIAFFDSRLPGGDAKL